MKYIIVKPNKKITTTLTSGLTNFALSHSRLLSIGIYAGVALAISAAMGFILYPDQQQLAFAAGKPRSGGV